MVDPVLVAQIEAALRARGAVRHGRHLRIRCPAPEHADQHPSADVDLSRGWVCRSCGRGGGLRSLAALLGLAPDRAGSPSPPLWRGDRPRPMVSRGVVDLDYARVADWVRACRGLIADRRRDASALGDTDEAWAVLANLADLERQVSMWESELEAERRDAQP
jgi:hypothetical protein